MKKKVMFLVGQNQYGVLSEMSGRLADYLEQSRDYDISRYEYEDLVRYGIDKEETWDFIFSSQGIEFNLFSGVDGKKHVIWLVDHPVYHLSRFGDYADKENLYIGCVDRTHVKYLKEICGIKNSFFFPHIGWESQLQIPYEKREIELLFPASYSDEATLAAKNAEWLNGAIKVVVERIVSNMLQWDHLTLEDGIRNTLIEMGESDDIALAEELENSVGWYIDACLRCRIRENVVRGLLEHGIRLTVCGRNWNKFQKTLCSRVAENLIILSEDIPYPQIVNKMACSKIVLNIMPWFKDGSHERVAMSTMNGAVCVTDESSFINETFMAEKEIVFYDRKNIEGLCDKIKWLLGHEEAASAIAAEGRKKSKDIFTVENIARRFICTNEFSGNSR